MRDDRELRGKEKRISRARPGRYRVREELFVGGGRGSRGKASRRITVGLATAC